MDERLYRGIREFNGRRYFEAHDILEDLWQEYRAPDRVFLQALIHTAVGFYHLDNHNFNGARSQLAKAHARMGPYVPERWGIAVGLLHSSLGRCLEMLQSDGEAERQAPAMLERMRIECS